MYIKNLEFLTDIKFPEFQEFQKKKSIVRTRNKIIDLDPFRPNLPKFPGLIGAHIPTAYRP